MKVFAAVVFAAVLGAAVAVPLEHIGSDLSVPAQHPDIIAAINSDPESTWTAGVNPVFENSTLAEIKNRCGSKVGPDAFRPEPLVIPDFARPESLPTDFDARKQWSHCPLIGKARDQSNCGSCWAFGSTEAFNDRKCIATNGAFQTELSAQDTTSCCSFLDCGFSQGCDGGQPGAAWQWFTSTGVVSGGGYNTIGEGKSCWPYQLPICAHHVREQGIANCSESLANAPACASSCSESKYSTPWSKDVHFAKSAYSVNSVEDIQTEIMTKGPVTAAFTVYADFPTYHSGVYQHRQGGMLGGHAIKIVGWGELNGTPYWTVMNSWNQGWGMDGAFLILRGSDECGIESQVSAGDV